MKNVSCFLILYIFVHSRHKLDYPILSPDILEGFTTSPLQSPQHVQHHDVIVQMRLADVHCNTLLIHLHQFFGNYFS